MKYNEFLNACVRAAARTKFALTPLPVVNFTHRAAAS